MWVLWQKCNNKIVKIRYGFKITKLINKLNFPLENYLDSKKFDEIVNLKSLKRPFSLWDFFQLCWSDAEARHVEQVPS